MNAIPPFSYLKLLTTTPSFAELIAATAPKSSVLTARLTFSWLAHRSRLGRGSSIRDISARTGIHQSTVSAALVALNGLVRKQGNNWIALEPPEGLFFQITPTNPEHWSDHFAYLKLFLPAKGEKLCYSETTRKFGLNHALIWSFLHRKAKESMIHGFTATGAATIFCLNPKTVSSILDDLVWLQLIERTTHKIKMLPLTDDHAKFFQAKPTPDERTLEPKEKKPRAVNGPYILQNDLWDSARRLCEGLMSQKMAETAISKAVQLGDDPPAFEAVFLHAKECHDQNILNGKVGKGNFGKYLIAIFDNRLRVEEEQERKAEEQRQLENYYLSPEYAQRRADEAKVAAADPQHHSFNPMDDRAVLDRVDLDFRLLDKIKTQIYQRIQSQLRGKNLPTQEMVDNTTDLRCTVIRRALSPLNRYYLQPVKASAEEFQSQIQSALDEVCGVASRD